jgi:hypothetical protein
MQYREQRLRLIQQMTHRQMILLIQKSDSHPHHHHQQLLLHHHRHPQLPNIRQSKLKHQKMEPKRLLRCYTTPSD